MKVFDYSDYETRKPLSVTVLEIKIGKYIYQIKEEGGRLEVMGTSALATQLAVYSKCSNVVHVGTVRK